MLVREVPTLGTKGMAFVTGRDANASIESRPMALNDTEWMRLKDGGRGKGSSC